MNKLIKGAVTGAAGIALLLGGAGTFAAWNSSATVLAGNSVQTGKLNVSANGTGTWFDVTNAASPVAISDISAYRIVPGATIEYRQPVTLNASGNDLAASLSFTNPTFSSANFGISEKFLNGAPAGVTPTADGKAFNVDPSLIPNGSVNTTVALDITFSGTTTGDTDQGTTVTFTDTKINFVETAPAK